MKRYKRVGSMAVLGLLFAIGCGDSDDSDDPSDSADDGNGDGDGEGDGDGADLDPQVPPADAAMMAVWLDKWASEGWESDWVCEAGPTAKTEGAAAIHVHNDADGKNRVCSNAKLAAVGEGQAVPKGSASLKFVGEKIYVDVKVADDSDDGKNWYWYAPGGAPEGLGIAACTGCHAVAGSDADHPGLGDYVYFQVE